MGSPERPVAQLRLELGADEVALEHLVSASSTFAGLLREVAREYFGRDRAVRWTVSIEEGSVVVPVRGETVEATAATFPLAAIVDLEQFIVGGLGVVDQEARRPPYFTNAALQQAKSLANLASDDLPIAVGNGRARAPLTKRVMTHVDEVLGPPRESFGTVEGRLETINIHGPHQFAVFDAVTGTRAECYFGDRIPLEEIGIAIGQRVSVRGRVKTRPDGSKQIDVTQFRRFTPESELPTAEDVRGILGQPG